MFDNYEKDLDYWEQLKPCPFCGKKDGLEIDDISPYNVNCRNCGCELYCLAETKDEAVKEWNRRAKC